MKITRKNFLLYAIILFLLLLNIALAKDGVKGSEKSFILSFEKIMTDVASPPKTFPKYTTQLINLANQNSQATRPRYVGQMSELIQKFPGNSFKQWEQWYMDKYPDALDQATDKTWAMVQKMRQAMAGIDRKMVRNWIQELTITKTYAGLCFQKSILKTISEQENTSYRLADPADEAKGIDGFIGKEAVSIKPVSYRSKPSLPETIDVRIIYYKKIRGGIRVWNK